MEGTECWETVRLYMASVADIGFESVEMRDLITEKICFKAERSWVGGHYVCTCLDGS